MTRPDQLTLNGRHVRLEPLQAGMVDDLLAASTGDRATYQWAWVPADRPGMQRYVEYLLAERDAGSVLPFVQRRTLDERIVGCTRFLNIHRWSTSSHDGGTPDEVEIGGTWLCPSAQRTPINTEAKLLLLTHAFQTWNVHRVAIGSDARNERSRRAIARLGATFEGVLRSHRMSYVAGEDGVLPRDTALYSIIRAEWPAVRANLERMLA